LIINPPINIVDLVGINCNIEGNKNALISGLGVINYINIGDMCFAENNDILQKLLQSNCQAIILRKQQYDTLKGHPQNKTFVITDNPSKLFASIIHKLNNSSNKSADNFPCDKKYLSNGSRISVDAFLAAGVKIGNNCIVYPQVFIDNNVIIGDDVVIMPGVKIFSNTSIGNNVEIHANSVIGGAHNWHYKDNDLYNNFPSMGGVVIQDNVFIGNNVTIDRGLIENTFIKNNVKLGNHVQIGHEATIEENVLIIAQCGIAGCVYIGKNSVIRGQSGINSNIRIAPNTVLNSKSIIISDITESNLTLFGIPAEEIKRYTKKQVALNKLPRIFKHSSFKIDKPFRERIAQIVHEQLGIEKHRLELAFRFKEDGNADSLDIVELLIAIEEEFDLQISNDDSDKILTIKDIHKFIYKILLRRGIKPLPKEKKKRDKKQQ